MGWHMEFLIIDIGATSAALLGYPASVFWHDVTSSRDNDVRGARWRVAVPGGRT